MKNPNTAFFFVGLIVYCATVGFVFQSARSNPTLEDEVKSLRDDLNQLTVVVSELDEPVIVVDGQVADETFCWECFHNVPVSQAKDD